MRKGLLMGVAGRIQTRSYDHKDGHKVYVTEVVAEEIKFLQWANDKNDNAAYSGGSDYGSFDDMTPIDDGDIPF